MSGKKAKAARREAGLSPEVRRGHSAFLRTMRDRQRAWEDDGPGLRERRTKRRILLALLALVLGCVALAVLA